MASSENGGFFKVPNIVMDCEGLTGTEKLVLLSLLRHFNAEQQRAWPSIRLIAKEACISNFWTVETLKRLEKKGVIRTEKKWGCGTRYEVVTSQLSLLVNSVEQSTQLNTLCNSVEQCCATQLNGLCNSVEPNNTNEQDNINKTKEQYKIAPAKKDDFAADFEEFWRAYPKPKNPDKTPTRKKYEALRKKGVSGDDLLKAAQGYARSTQGTDPRYIKHGATFLGPQEPWRDYLTEPEPVSDEPPDAEKLFPDLAEWMRRNRGIANGE